MTQTIQIGRGSFGKVYQIKDKGVTYAIKKIQMPFYFDQQCQEYRAVKNQVNLMKICQYHENIVKYYGFFQKQDYCAIVMEYVGNRTLANIHQLFNTQMLVEMTIQILQGLQHLHDNGIIHRDLKPQNIMISDQGVLKIGDFGVSKKLNIFATSRVGTFFYAAPQIIILEKQYDSKVDIWSFGIILYEYAYGKFPWQAQNMNQLKHKIINQSPKYDKTVNHNINSIIQGCLRIDPLKRLQLQFQIESDFIKQYKNYKFNNFSINKHK